MSDHDDDVSDTEAQTPVTNKKKRKIIRSEQREIVARVFHFLQDEYQFMKATNSDNCDLSPLSNVSKRTAEATGVGERTVTKILKEERNLSSTDGKFPAPLANRRKRAPKFDFNDTQLEIIRNTVKNYQTEFNEKPSIAKLKEVLKERIGFNGSEITLRKILINMDLYYWTEKNYKNLPKTTKSTDTG